MNECPEFHFLLVSATTWCTTGEDRSLTEAIDLMNKDRLTYYIWYVPCSEHDAYEINFYRPLVEGAHVVDMVYFVGGRKSKYKEPA